MASTVKQVNVSDGDRRALIKYLIIGDGSVEANTIILDPAKLSYALNANSQLLGSGTDRKTKYNYSIRRIYGNAKVDGYIKLSFQDDSNTDLVILTSGNFDYGSETMGDAMSIKSNGANAKGNLLMTVVGAGANMAATIFIDVKKDAADYDSGDLRDRTAFNA